MESRPSHYNSRYKHDLSPQQQRVLELIAKGRTNVEIADVLEISLDGVKWHVREILAKLAVESREEAADWWRAYQRPRVQAGRLLRSIFAAGTGKVGIASLSVGGIGVIAVLVLLLFHQDTGPSSSDELPACPSRDLVWRAQTRQQDDVSVYRLAVSLRDEQWYDSVFGVVGLGHRVTAPCRLQSDASIEIFRVGELVEGPSGKPEPLLRQSMAEVTGNPATVPVDATLREGETVSIVEARISNWCDETANVLIEASVPSVRKNGPPITSTSLGTRVDDLPPCLAAGSPATLTVSAP